MSSFPYWVQASLLPNLVYGGREFAAAGMPAPTLREAELCQCSYWYPILPNDGESNGKNGNWDYIGVICVVFYLGILWYPI